MTRFKLLFIGLTVGMACALAGAQPASAASVYDDTWHSVTPLTVERNGWGTCSVEDMSLNWSEIITNSDNWIGDKTAAKTSFENAIDNGRWGVSQARYKSGSNFEKSIWIFWTEDTGLALSWDLVGGRHQATPVSETSSDVHAAQIFQNSSCEPKFQSYYVGAGFSHASDEDWPLDLDGSSVANFFFYSDRLNIPAGYEGTPVNGAAPTPDAQPTFAPNIKLHKGSKWNVEFSDYNFFTIDEVLFTCKEGLAPSIQWRVYDITGGSPGTLIDELKTTASAIYNFQAEKINEDRKYKLIANYDDCPGNVFNEVSEKEFTIKKDGDLNQSDYMTVCITESAPWINIPGCWIMFNEYLNTISFNVLNKNNLVPATGNLTEGCRNLEVLGGWIGKPNEQVCPKIPAAVRNTITPFITLAVALMVVTFVARRKDIAT